MVLFSQAYTGMEQSSSSQSLLKDLSFTWEAIIGILHKTCMHKYIHPHAYVIYYTQVHGAGKYDYDHTCGNI